VKTATITYYGEGPLSLQMRRFKPGTSVKTRLDDILPDERRRYADRFLVVGPDGLIINIGALVPDKVAKEIIGVNPQILRIPGFDVRIPPGYALDDTGAAPTIVDAAVMAAKQETAVAVENPLEPIVVDIPVIDTPEVPAEEAVTTIDLKPEDAVKSPASPRRGRRPVRQTKVMPKQPKTQKKSKADDLMEMF